MLHNKVVRTGQTSGTISVLRTASATKQLTYGDVNAMCSSRRYYQQRVSKEKMAVVLEAYERKVSTLVKGASMYTIGAALLWAWECGVQTMLDMVVANADVATKAVAGDKAAGATTTGGGATTNGKARTADAVCRENESLKRQVANLKASKGRGGGRGHHTGGHYSGGYQ